MMKNSVSLTPFPRFFVDAPLASGLSLDLPESVSRHVQVLRLQKDDALTVFNGLGGEFPALIHSLGKKQVTVVLGDQLAREVEPPYKLTLAQGLAGGDKMDWLIEKAVELGVHAIQPLHTDKSVVRLSPERAEKRRTHWQAIAQAACEQCGRNTVPQLLPIASIQPWLEKVDAEAMRLMLSPRGTQTIYDISTPSVNSHVILLIGSEAGLSNQEEDLAQQLGWHSLSLGARILRTETAGLATISALHARWHGF